ncbi:MAG: HEAT repeat domain-containing protein [Planctomycetes bacterium]|nr:HEAT repeat domain-containing protein [Planctomycetota bacterium]
MTPASVTHPQRRHAPRARAACLLLVVLAGCASAGYTPGQLSEQQRAACRAVAQAFIDDAPEHEELRAELRRDPVAAQWYVRWLEVQVVRLREGEGEVSVSQTVKAKYAMLQLREDPGEWRIGGRRPESAAIDELAWFGELAVPVVVKDLLDPQQAFLRRLGIEMLVRIGAPAVPTLIDQVRGGDELQQRAAARALGEIGAEGAALEALAELSRSGDWKVRADVAQSLHRGRAGARDLLLKMLDDEDSFVRRKAAASLGYYRDAFTVRALADFLLRCQERRDFDAEVAAQNALQGIAQKLGARTVAAWRAFADELEQQEGAR